MNYQIFLAIQNKKGFIINCTGNKVSGMCPCCISASNRLMLMAAVKSAINNEVIEGKIKWVLLPGQGISNGSINNRPTPLDIIKEEYFEVCLISDLPKEVESEVINKASEL